MGKVWAAHYRQLLPSGFGISDRWSEAGSGSALADRCDRVDIRRVRHPRIRTNPLRNHVCQRADHEPGICHRRLSNRSGRDGNHRAFNGVTKT